MLNSKYYDLVVLPEHFKKFIEDFLKEIENKGYGCLFYYPHEQVLLPGIAKGDQNKYDLARLEKIFSLAHMVYLIKLALTQKNYFVNNYNEEEIYLERINHEKYFTITINKNPWLK